MYVLERYVFREKEARPQHRWIKYVLCGSSAPLERVLQGQRKLADWRIIQIPGSVQSALLGNGGTASMLKAG